MAGWAVDLVTCQLSHSPGCPSGRWASRQLSPNVCSKVVVDELATNSQSVNV